MVSAEESSSFSYGLFPFGSSEFVIFNGMILAGDFVSLVDQVDTWFRISIR